MNYTTHSEKDTVRRTPSCGLFAQYTKNNDALPQDRDRLFTFTVVGLGFYPHSQLEEHVTTRRANESPMVGTSGACRLHDPKNSSMDTKRRHTREQSRPGNNTFGQLQAFHARLIGRSNPTEAAA